MFCEIKKINRLMEYFFCDKSFNIRNLFALVFLFFLASCGGEGNNNIISNIHPIANAGDDKSVEINQSILIEGSGLDIDGEIVSYEWKKDGNVLSASSSFNYTPIAIGSDVLTLSIKDNEGLSASDTMIVNVIAAGGGNSVIIINNPPTADAGDDKTVKINQSILIEGSGLDIDGEVVSYEWKKDGNVLSTSSSFNYTPIAIGFDVLTLTVKDNEGLSASDIMIVNVIAAATQSKIIKQFFNYGQSLSLGSKASPLLSSTQPYNNIMFNGGLNARANPGKLTSFVPLVESRNVETQSSATANNITKLIENENGIAFNDQTDVYLASNPGSGARKISELSNGSIFYDSILIQTQAAKEITQALGIPHQVSFITFMQGESNYTNPPMPAITYATALSNLINDLNSDVSAITNQSSSFPMINYQIASHRFKSRAIPTVALGHLLASKTDNNIYLAVPMYIFDYVDNLHTDNQSNRQIGNYFGRTYKRVAIDNIDWKPLQPKTISWQGKTIDIKFDVPIGPIVFDTSWVSAEINQGFDIWNSELGEILDIIQSVTVIGVDTVRISMSLEPPTGSYVSYAFGRDTHNGFSGRTLGPRGNLRDSAGDSETGPLGRMDNYSVIFSDRKM